MKNVTLYVIQNIFSRIIFLFYGDAHDIVTRLDGGGGGGWGWGVGGGVGVGGGWGVGVGGWGGSGKEMSPYRKPSYAALAAIAITVSNRKCD